jgi:DNA-binding SARP family transcriptional activator
MEFRVLGPLEVVDGARPVPINGAKQRALLTILLLHANKTVSSGWLLEELWGDEQPESGLTALQVRVSQLRKALGKGGEIVTKPVGYALELGANELDLHRFEELVADADRALQRDASDQAWAQLQQALSLWRGPPLADFAAQSFASAAIARLEELRLVAQELRIDAGLRLARHAELVAELDVLIAEHPLRERLRHQHMLALYRSGRQAEALGAYRAARRALVEELGIAPSPMLQELEGAILRQDRSLDLAPTRARRRSILAGAVGDQPLAQLLAAAAPLARDPTRELIVARLIVRREQLAAAGAAVAADCDRLAVDGVVARPAVFTRRSPGVDLARLATEQDADLVLIALGGGALDDPELVELLRSVPCDVAVVVGRPVAAPGPVLVPFAGGEHDWSAVEPHARQRLARGSARGRRRGTTAAYRPGAAAAGHSRTRSRRLRRRAAGGVAHRRARRSTRCSCEERPAHAPRPQRTASGRLGGAREPDAVHMDVPGGLISSPTPAACASRTPATSRWAAGRRLRNSLRKSARRPARPEGS